MDSLRDHWWFEMQKQGVLDEEHMVPTRFFLGREAVPPTVTKVVINLRGEDPEVSQMWPFTVDLPEHVKELVIVGPRYSSLKHWGSVGDLTPEVAVDNLAEVMFNPHAEKVTFVGFERMPAIKEDLEASLRETYRTATYDDVDYEIDDEATRHLPKTKRVKLIREAKRRRAERMKAYNAGKASVKSLEENENKHKDQGNSEDGGGCDGAVGEENEEEGSIAPLLGYKQKIDRMLASYEFVTKHAYVRTVGEETAALELLEYLDPKDRKFKKGRHWRHR